MTAEGFSGAEEEFVNEMKSEGGGDSAGPPAAAPAAAAPTDPADPVVQAQAAAQPGQPLVQPELVPQPGAAAAAAQPGQAAAAQPGAAAAQPGQAAAAQPGAAAAQPGQAQPAPALNQPGKSSAEESAGASGKAKTPQPPPTITSATRKAAAGGGSATRTTVAVGEVIDFTGSAAGTWTATGGTPAAGASGTAFAWTAPDAPATVTITLTVGTQTATKDIAVIAPDSISMAYSSSHSLTAGTAGVCMLTNMTVGPMTVSFGNTEQLEEPGPATGVTGYFQQFSASTLQHRPSTRWARWNDRNTGPRDHASSHSVPPPYSAGSFQWVIPNKYRVVGTSGAGTVFTSTTQVFSMADATGTMSVSKAGASTTRSP